MSGTIVMQRTGKAGITIFLANNGRNCWHLARTKWAGILTARRVSGCAAVIILLISGASVCIGASLEKAEMLRTQGLLPQAKVELIDVIFSAAPDANKALAYYNLGLIDLQEDNMSSALETWTRLVEKYPTSVQATQVKDRIKDLTEIVGKESQADVDNAVAESYLRNGDFWSEGKDSIFHIDTSWIPREDAAVKWYDKVIAEFPKSVGARVAYEAKLRTLLGWTDPGEDGAAHGARLNFDEYMPQALQTFTSFEAAYPDASTLQAYRYQIAQAYWGHKDWENTRKWLNLVIQNAGTSATFYKDLAQRRLEKVEY